MFSACEDCTLLFPASMGSCPVCHQVSDWLCQTYDVDAVWSVPVDTTSSAAAVK